MLYRHLKLIPLSFLITFEIFSQHGGYIAPCEIDNYFGSKNFKTNAVNVVTERKTPAVLNKDTPSFLYELITTGIPSSIEFEPEGSTSRIKFLDNGTNGDKVANDGIFSLIIAKPTKGWDGLGPLGYAYVYESGNLLYRRNLFVLLRTAEMPTIPIRKINDKIQFTDYIFNIVDEVGSKKFTNEDMLAKEFYKYHGDNFDFLNFILVPGFTDNRFHSVLRNTVKGTGQNEINVGANYGSASRLKGFNYAPQLDVFDGINNGFNHETGHQWINYAKTSFLKEGAPHFPASNLAYGVMGISIGGAGGAGGDFSKIVAEEGNNIKVTAVDSNFVFNDWELYLMGLIPAKEVKSKAIIFKDQSKFPSNGTFPKTDFNIYTIDDFISQVGARIPDASISQKQFTMATIVVSEKLLNDDEMAYLNHNLKRAESNVEVLIRSGLTTYKAKSFQKATKGFATMRTLLNTNYNCATVPIKPSIVSNNNFKICENSEMELSVNTLAGDQIFWYYRGVPMAEKTSKIKIKIPGNYSASIRNSAGCNSFESDEKLVSIVAIPAKPIITNTSNIFKICENTEVELSLKIATTDQINWYVGDVLLADKTQKIKVKNEGIYSAIIKNNDGCSSLEADKVIISKAITPPKPIITSNNNFKICNNAEIELSVNSAATDQINWFLGGVLLAEKTPKIKVKIEGVYSAIVKNSDGCNSVEADKVTISKANPPSKPTIQSSNGLALEFGKSTILSVPTNSNTFYQWLKDGANIVNATKNEFEASQTGSYTVNLTNNAGCSVQSDAINVFVKEQLLAYEKMQILSKLQIAPNPNKGKFKISFNLETDQHLIIYLADAQGRILRKLLEKNSNKGVNEINIDISDLSDGIYLLQIEGKNGIINTKILKM